MDIEEKRRRNREYMKGYLQRRMEYEPEKVREEKRLWAAAKRARDPVPNREAAKSYAKRNPEKVKERYDAWKANNPGYHTEWNRQNRKKNPKLYLWRSVRNRAKEEGIFFDLVPEDIVVPTHCPVLGIPLALGASGFAPDCASVDRIVPQFGYTKGNIAVISVKANVIKRDATPDELEKVAAYARRETERVLKEHGV